MISRIISKLQTHPVNKFKCSKVKKRKLYLHIGTEKTGTTTLQEFLFNNKESLYASRYFIPTSIGEKNNRHLVSIVMDIGKYDDFFRVRAIDCESKKIEFINEALTRFDNEIMSIDDNVNSVIISSEHFHSRIDNIDEIKRLKSFLDNYFYEIEVIIYLRKQSEVIESLYSTVLKTGNSLRFNEFVDNQITKNRDYYDYNKKLNLWSEVFGKNSINVNVFEKNSLYKKDLIEDFLFNVNINNLDYLELERENESCSYLGQVILRSINSTLPNFNEHGFDVHKSQIINNVATAFSGKGIKLSIEQIGRIESEFFESNENLKSVFFPERSRLFSEMLKNIDQDQMISVEQDLAIENLIMNVHRHGGNNDSIPDYCADSLREAALLLEGSHLPIAYEVMKVASMIRPTGPFIAKKLSEYAKALAEQKS